ncbi:MAG: ATP-binding protein [Victivallales bacterium]|nr:ATP-binding protein [Victivallales bacterium]
MSAIFHAWKNHADEEILRECLLKAVCHLLELGMENGFDQNLWQDYLTYHLLMAENPFTLACERRGATPGASVNQFAKDDFECFRKLFRFDFHALEKDLGVECFQTLTNYRAAPKAQQNRNQHVSSQVRKLSGLLAKTRTAEQFFDLMTTAYAEVGVGQFGLNRAFRIRGDGAGGVKFITIDDTDSVRLSSIVGYERQKALLRTNTEAFLAGRPANNVLLYGDSGTGKSTSVKALINEYHGQGLRMVEIYKHQFQDLSATVACLKNRAYRFILFLDDLSFEENEQEYKYLKAVIEGGVEKRPDNVLIYATSNRRHLVRETWNDRSDMEHGGDIHRSDTVEEKLSLAERFGVSIHYGSPTPKEYRQIVEELAKREGISLTDEQLVRDAHAWEISHGGVSGRTAEQYITWLKGR